MRSLGQAGLMVRSDEMQENILIFGGASYAMYICQIEDKVPGEK